MNSRSEAPLKTQAKAQESRKTAAAVLGVLASGICAVAAVPPVQNLAAQMADDTPRPRVALTFDDGPHPVYTKRLLDGLRSRGIRATFFVVGENISGSEELIRRMADEGHVIGNHTYSHQKGWGMSLERYLEDVDFANDILHTDLFRPPYARIKPSHAHRISERYNIVMWDVLSRGYSRLI